MSPVYSPPGALATHAANHLPAGSDAISWASGINQSGLDASKPAAAASNAGELYRGTDTGVAYRSTGSAWAPFAWDSDFPYIFNGGGVIRESWLREASTTAGAYITSGVMFHTALPLMAGDVVTNLSTFTSNVTPSGITNWWFALYDTQATPALLQQTADQGSAALPNLSKFTLALNSPVTITITGLYYAALMVAASTTPSFATRQSGSTIISAGFGTQVRIGGTSGSGLTTTAPATIATPTTVPFMPYMATS